MTCQVQLLRIVPQCGPVTTSLSSAGCFFHCSPIAFSSLGIPFRLLLRFLYEFLGMHALSGPSRRVPYFDALKLRFTRTTSLITHVVI